MVCVLQAGCLVSQTPVRPGSGGQGRATISGFVYRDWHTYPSGRVVVPGMPVKLTWLAGDARVEIGATLVWTDGAGTYRVTIDDARVSAVTVQTATCRYDPKHPDPAIGCCLLLRPNCTNCAGAWLNGEQVWIGPGAHVRYDLNVQCW
jgi:hypothetical protein